MTVDEMVAVLDDHGFADTSSDRKIEALNAAYHEVAGAHPWPFLEKTSSVNTDSTGKVTQPAGGAFRAVIRLLLDPYGRLDWIRRDEFLDAYFFDRDQTGDPFLYFFIGQDIFVWPNPGAQTGIGVIDYLTLEPDLEAGGAESTVIIPARYHRVIVYRALVDLYTMEDDPELAAAFQALYQDKLARMENDLLRLQFDRPQTIRWIDDGFGSLEA